MTRRLCTVFAFTTVLALTPALARAAQDEPAPPSMATFGDSLGDAMGGMMGPMMTQMMEGMMKAVFTVLAKPETADHLATFTKNYFDALVKRGFTREEAMRIVVSVGVPTMPGAK